MRTTLTIDPDVAKLLEQEAHRLRKPFKQVVNDALRRGLAGAAARDRLPPYRVVPHQAALRTGIDRLSLSRLAAELDDEAVAAKFRHR